MYQSKSNMNILRTPDDSTAVVRIMGEFSEFLSHSTMASPRERLTFDDYSSVGLQKETRPATKAKVQSPQLSREREKDVEIIKGRSKIAYLESQINTLETSRKRSRIELEKEARESKADVQRREEKYEDMHKSLQYVVEQEKSAKEQLRDIKKEYEKYKNKAELKMQNLQREKLKMSSELDQVREETSQQLMELRHTVARNEADKIMMQNQLEETGTQLKNAKRKLLETSNHLPELEEFRARTRTAEHKVKELEQKLCCHNETAEISKIMHSQLTKYRELEKENLKLAEDNHYYREINESNLLLKEKIESLNGKLERSEQRNREMGRVEMENEQLKKKVQQWESQDLYGNKKLMSPLELKQEVAKLQQSQIVLLEQQSELKSSAKIHEASYKTVSEELTLAKEELSKLKESNSQLKDLSQRLQRRLVLVTSERDGCRRILGTYDNVWSANYDPQLRARLKEAEDSLKSCDDHIESLEMELNQAKEESSEEKHKCRTLEAEISNLKNYMKQQLQEKHVDSSGLGFRSELERLKVENSKLQEQLSLYELNKEQRHIQGYYDPTKTKVLHFSMNPTAVAMQQRAEELEKLRRENDTLKEKILALEQSGCGQSTGPTATVAADGSFEKLGAESAKNKPSVAKQVEDVKAQLLSSELKNQRLKEVFSKKIQEFREACYVLTGYKLDIVRDNQYRLHSMYAEQSGHNLLFESNSKGEMMMLATDFSEQLGEQMDMYLKRRNSIPAFLSSVTLELFSRQTQTVVID